MPSGTTTIFFSDKRKISDLFLDGFGNGDGFVREEHGKPCDTDYQTFLKRERSSFNAQP